MAQELLTTFSTDIGEIALMPCAGGVFEIRIGDDAVWSRAERPAWFLIEAQKKAVPLSATRHPIVEDNTSEGA